MCTFSCARACPCYLYASRFSVHLHAFPSAPCFFSELQSFCNYFGLVFLPLELVISANLHLYVRLHVLSRDGVYAPRFLSVVESLCHFSVHVRVCPQQLVSFHAFTRFLTSPRVFFTLARRSSVFESFLCICTFFSVCVTATSHSKVFISAPLVFSALASFFLLYYAFWVFQSFCKLFCTCACLSLTVTRFITRLQFGTYSANSVFFSTCAHRVYRFFSVCITATCFLLRIYPFFYLLQVCSMHQHYYHSAPRFFSVLYEHVLIYAIVNVLALQLVFLRIYTFYTCVLRIGKSHYRLFLIVCTFLCSTLLSANLNVFLNCSTCFLRIGMCLSLFYIRFTSKIFCECARCYPFAHVFLRLRHWRSFLPAF